LSRRQRRTKEKRRRRAAPARNRVRSATITGSLAATAAIGLASGAEAADAATFDAAQVKDINPSGNSSPGDFVELNGVLLFHADDGTSGYELWRTDGTEAGTYMLKDIAGGAGQGSYPQGLTNVNGTVFFSAFDGNEPTSDGTELWMTDGTAAGTQLVEDISPSSGSFPSYLTESGGLLFFSADDAPNNPELWRSDGTETGTYKIEEINSSGGSFPGELTDVGGTLFFAASDTTLDRELWMSDGTLGGADRVADINASGDGNPRHLADLGGTLFFSAIDGPDSGTTSPPSGYELWKSDGSTTQLVKDINPTDSGYPYYLTNVGGTLFFQAFDGPEPGFNSTELWKSDGTSGGTQLVKDINPTGYSAPNGFTGLGGSVFFAANDGTYGYELWGSDGTGPGTQLVKDIRPGSATSDPDYLTEMGGNLFFVADDGSSGDEPWVSDGTGAGTALVKDINPSGSSSPGHLTGFGGNLFFSATDGTTGLELWKTFPAPPPPAGTTPAPAPLAPAPTFNLKAAIKKCKKKFPKGPKRKRCIRKAKAKARALG
jgi:ELWxxDGT repeat protein